MDKAGAASNERAPGGESGLTSRGRAVLTERAASLGITLDDAAVERFSRYLSELIAWNKTRNLTAIRDPAEIVTRHFLDALTCVRGYDFSINRPVIDVGAGAGFPGLPLKIAFPNLQLSLLDASIKKVEFLKHVCHVMGLNDVDVAHGRAEEFGHVGSYRQRFYLCVTRGLAGLPVLAELCLPFVTIGGYLLAQKNLALGEEWEDGLRAIPALGGGAPEMIEVTPPGGTVTRALIRIRKETGTPSAYPRRPGVPARRPLGKLGEEGQRKHNKYGGSSHANR